MPQLIYHHAEHTDGTKFPGIIIQDLSTVSEDTAKAVTQMSEFEGYAANRLTGYADVVDVTVQTTEVLDLEDWKAKINGEWKLDKIIAEVNADTPDEEGMKSCLLGSLINPSGKYYVPFACSNVAGDCPVCDGRGAVFNIDADKVSYSRALLLEAKFYQRMSKQFGFYCDFPPRQRSLLDAIRKKIDEHRTTKTCPACWGSGSLSAQRDEDWREAFEKLLEPHGMHLENSEHDSVLYLVTKHEPVSVPDDG